MQWSTEIHKYQKKKIDENSTSTLREDTGWKQNNGSVLFCISLQQSTGPLFCFHPVVFCIATDQFTSVCNVQSLLI